MSHWSPPNYMSFCAMRNRGKGGQSQPQVFNSRVTMSSLLSEEKFSEPDPENNPEGMAEGRGSQKKSRFY